MKTKVLLLVSLLFFGAVNAQKVTNVQRLRRVAQEKRAESQRLKQEAIDYARQRNIPIRFKAEFAEVELMRFENGMPVYYSTDNINAAATTRADELWPGGGLGLSLSGTGYTKLAEWDGGLVRTTHQEFNNTGSARIVQMDGATTLSDHGTHVAGIMVAGGVDANAKGMAFNAQLKAYDWNSDESEMRSEAASDLELSNHSYGPLRGWYYNSGEATWYWAGDTRVSQTEDNLFGLYTAQAADWDDIAYDAPYYLILASAGNDRGQGPSPGTSHKVWDYDIGNYITSTTTRQVDGGPDGYDCIGNAKVGKNIITVGAVDDVLNYTGPFSVVMSSFSCWGPVDDGRIKPDIVANGVWVYSSTSGSDTEYSSYNGTSMATPNATGTLTLLRQHYQNLNTGSVMRAATLKALAIHTADEAGDAVGPDYIHGWGLLNAERAALQIDEDFYDQNVMDELSLSNGGTYTRDVTVSGLSPLRVTIVWTDPPGTPLAENQLDPPTPALVNDLDLRITDPSSGTHYAYKLDANNPANPATATGENDVDNVEMVYISDTETGTYTISVDHDGTLTNGPQAFSIMISGIDEYTQVPGAVSLSNPSNGDSDTPISATLTWRGADRADHYKVYVGTDGGGVTRPTNWVNGATTGTESYALDNLAGSTTYYWQIVPANNQGDGTASPIWSFSTIPVISAFPFTENFDGVSTPNLPAGWSYEGSTKPWQSYAAGQSTPNCVRSFNGYVQSADDWLFSLPLNLEAGKMYSVEFWYRGYGNSAYDETLHTYWGEEQNSAAHTKLLSSYEHFTSYPWREAVVRLLPETSNNFYFGWHAASGSDGVAIYLDDIYIHDTTPTTLADADDPGNALDFDGVNDYVSIGAVEEIRTLELWVKPATTTDVILQLDSGQYLHMSSGTLDMVGQSGETIYVNGELSTTITAGVWSHVAIVLASSVSGSDVRLASGNSDYYQGELDDFRIWKTVRTQSHVQDNAHNIAQTDDADLFVYFKCDHTSGTSLADMTSNVIDDGSLTGMDDSDWIVSTAPLGQVGEQVHGTGSANARTVGETGKQMQATLTADGGNSSVNYIGIYSSGKGDQQIDDPTLPSGAYKRANIVWGVAEYGSVTADLVFSYENLPETTGSGDLMLLKRSTANTTWTDVTSSATHNTSQKTFTLSGQESFSQFGLGYAPPISVNLISFDAVIHDDAVQLSWQTAEEIDHAGFNILRSESKDGTFAKVNSSMIRAKGGNGTAVYTYMDLCELKSSMHYKLESVNLDGSSSRSESVAARTLSGIDQHGLPTEFTLYDNYPNPFNPQTTIRYDLAGTADVVLNIYDITGRLVRTLVEEKQSIGRYTVTWNGREHNGRTVASGIYFITFKAGEHEFRKKATLIR